MSQANQPTAEPRLTDAQKEAARRMNINEKEYAKLTADLIKTGRINPENIK